MIFFISVEEKRRGVAEQQFFCERLTERKPVRNEVASERGYCRIISVAGALARDYWYYPQYPIFFKGMHWISTQVLRFATCRRPKIRFSGHRLFFKFSFPSKSMSRSSVGHGGPAVSTNGPSVGMLWTTDGHCWDPMASQYGNSCANCAF